MIWYQFWYIFRPAQRKPEHLLLLFFSLVDFQNVWCVWRVLTVKIRENRSEGVRFLSCNSLATLDKILWEAVKSGVACIGCKCGQCLKVTNNKTQHKKQKTISPFISLTQSSGFSLTLITIGKSFLTRSTTRKTTKCINLRLWRAQTSTSPSSEWVKF